MHKTFSPAISACSNPLCTLWYLSSGNGLAFGSSLGEGLTLAFSALIYSGFPPQHGKINIAPLFSYSGAIFPNLSGVTVVNSSPRHISLDTLTETVYGGLISSENLPSDFLT